MNRLSVVIITFNEEKNIAQCIESVSQIADEIVVVDSISTDNTKQICQHLGAIFIEQPFLGYIEQKNFALKAATNNYCLCIDADERLSTQLQQQIKEAKNNGFAADGYTMNRCNNFRNKWIKHGTWYPDKKLRLLNKNLGYWGGTNPHDKMEITTKNIVHLKGDLLHYSYNSIEEMMAQNNKFTTIQAQAMFAEGKRSSYLKIIINPLVAFINGFILKAGFLDGVDGYIIAQSIAYHTMIKYAKLMHLQRQ